MIRQPRIVFDIETVLDEDAVARAHNLTSGDTEAIKAIIGDGFPKPIFHKIVAIAAATFAYDINENVWTTVEMASLHTGRQSEEELVGKFVDHVSIMKPIVVGYNSLAFDLPVVRARAMLYRQSSWHMAHSSFKPFSDHHIDLCEILGGRARSRMTLDEAVRFFGIGAKTDGMDGSKVEDLAAEGRFQEIADYCLDDVAATGSLFLLHETFSGRMSAEAFERARQDLLRARGLALWDRSNTFIRQSPLPPIKTG